MAVRKGKANATGRSSGKIGGRAGRLMKPPKGEPWAWLTREMMTSEAWRSLTINARRFVDFLMVEHMNHGGTENGNLRATYDQLQEAGLTRNCIADAIVEAEDVGFVGCQRGGMRVASTYTLTWLPDRDGSPATNQWKAFQNAKSAPRSETSKPPEVRPDSPDLPPEVRPDQTPRSETPSRLLEGATSDKLAWTTPTYIEIARPKRQRRPSRAPSEAA